MQVSSNGLDLVKRSEGFVAHVYADQAGLPTIGYGHLISRQELGLAVPEKETPETLAAWRAAALARYPRDLTQEEVDQLLQKDLDIAGSAVSRLVTASLSQNQFDALVDFVFNVGEPSLKISTLRRRLNAGDYQIANEFTKWNKVRNPKTGQLEVNAGLTMRRQREADLWRADA